MRFESAPAIDGPVVLRPLEHRHVDAWFAYLSLPDVLEHTSWKLAHRDELAAIVDGCASTDAESPMRFAIVDRDEEKLLGTIGFPQRSAMHRTAEIAYDLAPAAWGRGIATVCCRAVADWALHDQGFVRVQATVVDSNRASQRVLEKAGFDLEGKLANLKMIRGLPRDFLLFAKTRTP